MFITCVVLYSIMYDLCIVFLKCVVYVYIMFNTWVDNLLSVFGHLHALTLHDLSLISRPS